MADLYEFVPRSVVGTYMVLESFLRNNRFPNVFFVFLVAVSRDPPDLLSAVPACLILAISQYVDTTLHRLPQNCPIVF